MKSWQYNDYIDFRCLLMPKQLNLFSLSLALITSSVVLGTWVDTIKKYDCG